MADKPNFVLIPDDAPPPVLPAGSSLGGSPGGSGGFSRLLTLATTAVTAAVAAAKALPMALGHAEPPTEAGPALRPRLLFAIDATASREPAWAAARQVTDALVQALPGELDVALAVHGGSRVHTFSAFTNDAATLRDRTAGITCEAGMTRLLPILSASLKQPAMRVVVYVGDVFEESIGEGRRLADEMGARGIKLIVLHDTADPAARRDAELFWDLSKRTGGCVLAFDAGASQRLRELLEAVAVYAVGGETLLEARRRELPGAVTLLEQLGTRR